MDKRKSQQYNFGLDAIPILFHSQTTQFLVHLKKDGVKFLQFWWDHVGDRMPEEKRGSSAGLTFETEQINEKTMMVIITLPTPKEDRDPYFIGLIARPEKRVLWVRLPTTEAYALVRDDLCKQPHLTSLGYLTPNGLFRPRGIGLNPTKQDFKRIIKSKINAKKKRKFL